MESTNLWWETHSFGSLFKRHGVVPHCPLTITRLLRRPLVRVSLQTHLIVILLPLLLLPQHTVRFVHLDILVMKQLSVKLVSSLILVRVKLLGQLQIRFLDLSLGSIRVDSKHIIVSLLLPLITS